MTDQAFVHPLSGALLEATHANLRAAKTDGWAEIDRLKVALAPISERLAELDGPAVLPRPRWQTDKQRRIATCPRCGTRPELGANDRPRDAA